MEIYRVGGAVRDELLGLKSKDEDFAVVADSYEAMREGILKMGCKIYLETPEYFTIRAHHPTIGPADFVWCRLEGPYSDGRHPDWVKPGTLYDDLARRDFTMNAIAVDMDGNIIDPFLGKIDIYLRQIRCVLSPEEQFAMDRLRMLRAIRFAITRGMQIHWSISRYFRIGDVSLEGVSTDRIREELYKMYWHNTLKSNDLLWSYPRLKDEIFSRPDLWLKPTVEKI